MHVPSFASLAIAAALGWVGAVTFRAATQDAPPKRQAEAAQDPAAAFPKPKATRHHKLLAAEAGQWRYSAKMWMGPGEPTTWKGEEETKFVCDGLFLVTHATGSMMGQPFEGFGATGWNSAKKQYEAVWFDNFGEYLTLSRGTCSKDGKVRTMHATMPGMDGTPTDYRMVNTTKDEDTRLFEMFVQTPGRQEFKNMEIRYERSK